MKVSNRIYHSSKFAAFLIVTAFLAACSSGTVSEKSPDAARQYPMATPNVMAANSNTSATMGSPWSHEETGSGERYEQIEENPFLETIRAPLSTFSVDVDTASYANVRRFLNEGRRPPTDAVRIEELVNYFDYEYPQPIGEAPFSVTTEVAAAPWNTKHKIVQIGLQGKKMSLEDAPPSNLVFLLDVSGSMNATDKLPLLKESLKILVNQMSERDRIAIVTYAGSSGLALPSVNANRRAEILDALNNLEAGGSTNGGEGIQLAYKIAEQNFLQSGNNRVILATDGDFNVGLSSDAELVNLIELKRQSGIFLSVFGFGTGNINDSMMEKLADKGNGNYSYIDSLAEAKKSLGAQVSGTLHTIAKDVKIQVEFNPATVAGYRLIGYENRLLAAEDFNDDRKDAGEIGAGHSVTALYEIVPAGQKIVNPGIDQLKYSQVEKTDTLFNGELLTLKLRYKEPTGGSSKLLTAGVLDRNLPIENASNNLKFAATVAEFGMLLRGSRYKGDSSFASTARLAQVAMGNDLNGYRAEFVELVKKAERLY